MANDMLNLSINKEMLTPVIEQQKKQHFIGLKKQ